MLQKQPIPIPFVHGLDTKTDPKQVTVGKFLSLQNSIFTTTGEMRKRDGYGPLTTLPNPASYITTFGGNLTAIGSTLQAYSNGTKSWLNKGTFQPISLNVVPAVRSALSQTQADSVIASNNFVCTVFSEANGGTYDYKYVIQDYATGQYIVGPTLIPVSSGVVTGSPRVFLLGGYFIVVFTNVITATSHLQYIAISVNSPTTVTANTDIASGYGAVSTVSWDGVVADNKLFIAYDTSAGGQQIKITYLNTSLVLGTTVSFASEICTIMSMYVDLTNLAQTVIYAAYYDVASTTGKVLAIDNNLNKLMSPTTIISSGTVNNITCTAQNGICTIAYEVAHTYSYDSNIASNFLDKVTVTKPATITTGTVGSTTTFVRSVGLASKAFLLNGSMYMLAAYDGKTSTVAAFQPTYFLINLSGQVLARLAYQNGGGYLATGLPQAQVIGNTVNISYLFKDLIQAVNKTQGAVSASGVYSQTGVNIAAMEFSPSTLSTAEIGKNLNISGGMLYAYDGNTLSEQNFNLYPDSIEATWSTSGGSVHAQPDGSTNTNAYAYQVIYQQTDAQGNIFNSAPSIPIFVTTTGSGTSGSITVTGPYARLTYKSNVKIIIFRWSVANQEYFQVTSISAPLLNVTTSDSWSFVDTQADASIQGNSLIYTTGGVVEDVGGPSCTAQTIFDTRLWLVDAEDKNLLWYSKQIIEGTPVEMSDLFTFYIAPNAGTNASVGQIQCIFPMDDKLIIWLHSANGSQAIYYLNGTGPDNTGANSQFSQPIFITSTVSCTNQNSIVLIPQGLMFQAADGKGIWLLDRSLGTQFIGDRVQSFSDQEVNSVVNVPGTTFVLFTLSSGTMLMYDYYYNEWGTFVGQFPVSSTIFQGLHTIINSQGLVSQQTPGLYMDNGNPVNMQFQTGWIAMANLQGYQRAYYFYLLGEYISPHTLQVGIAYDYLPNVEQFNVIHPLNFAADFGDVSPFGAETPFGGQPTLEQWKIHLKRQKCQAFQITIQENFDPIFATQPGAGLTLSGLNIIAAVKRGSRPLRATQTIG